MILYLYLNHSIADDADNITNNIPVVFSTISNFGIRLRKVALKENKTKAVIKVAAMLPINKATWGKNIVYRSKALIGFLLMLFFNMSVNLTLYVKLYFQIINPIMLTGYAIAMAAPGIISNFIANMAANIPAMQGSPFRELPSDVKSMNNKLAMAPVISPTIGLPSAAPTSNPEKIGLYKVK